MSHSENTAPAAGPTGFWDRLAGSTAIKNIITLGTAVTLAFGAVSSAQAGGLPGKYEIDRDEDFTDIVVNLTGKGRDAGVAADFLIRLDEANANPLDRPKMFNSMVSPFSGYILRGVQGPAGVVNAQGKPIQLYCVEAPDGSVAAAGRFNGYYVEPSTGFASPAGAPQPKACAKYLFEAGTAAVKAATGLQRPVDQVGSGKQGSVKPTVSGIPDKD